MSTKLADLEAELKALKDADYERQCSDDRYYSNGGFAASQKAMKEVEAKIAEAKAAAK